MGFGPDGDARLAAASASIDPVRGAAPDDVRLAGRALMPGTINAHCHTFQSLLRGLGRRSRLRRLARSRALTPSPSGWIVRGSALGAAFAFAEMLQSGVTTCVDFFYLQDQDNANAEAVIEAARTIGIRLVLARGMYDWDGAPKRYRETVARRGAPDPRADHAAHRNDETTVVQPAPHSPHGASPAMIRAGWEIAADGRPRGFTSTWPRGATRASARSASTAPRRSAISTAWARWARG